MSLKIVIDAKDGVLGRIASFAAKQALLGKDVIIVNCNYALVLGKRDNIVSEYGSLRRKGGASLNGPFFPKDPQRIMKRTIRGMLDHTKGRGEKALQKVMCYNEIPEVYTKEKKISISREIKSKHMTLAALEEVI